MMNKYIYIYINIFFSFHPLGLSAKTFALIALTPIIADRSVVANNYMVAHARKNLARLTSLARKCITAALCATELTMQHNAEL